MRSLAMLALVSLLSACASRDSGVRFFAEGQPKALSEWGVLKVEDGRLSLNAGVVPYDLNSPLFSDYAHKLRTIWMPKGKSARYDAQNSFDFPVGTIISKTFYYPLPGDGKWNGKSVARTAGNDDLRNETLDLSKVHLIETRLLVRREKGWEAMPYVWNEAQTDATLKRAGDLISLELVDSDGGREAADYQVPDQNQCASCHATDNKTRALHPIGPKARHLNRDFAYAAGNENQIAHLARAGYLTGAPDPAQAPRNADWQDAAHARLEDRARAYLDVNCGHCHSQTGPAITSGMWLDAAITDHLKLGFCKQPVAAGKGTGNRLYDIAPGQADASVLVFRMDSDDPSVMMPELGRSVVHREGVELIREWINAQKGACDT
ncbi:MAG TPA: SO2930 family diheme c-type cytochrome [Pseudoxanthomonas sp.]